MIDDDIIFKRESAINIMHLNTQYFSGQCTANIYSVHFQSYKWTGSVCIMHSYSSQHMQQNQPISLQYLQHTSTPAFIHYFV